MKVSFGLHVKHKRTGWTGQVLGVGYGRKPERWQNPDIIYVDWFHRKPATTGHLPNEIEIPYPSPDR